MKIDIKGFDGQMRTIRVSRRHLSTILRADVQSPLRDFDQLFPQADLAGLDEYDPLLFSAVWLPDGKSYKFLYNDYTELARLELPTGGAIEYDIKGGYINSPESGYYLGEIYRRLVERRVYVDSDNVPESKTTYSKPDTGQGLTFTSVNYVDVDHWKPSSPDERLARERHYYHGNAMQALTLKINGSNWVQTRYPAFKDGKEFQTDILAADGLTVLRTTKYEWQQSAPAAWWTGPHEAPNGYQWYVANPQSVSWSGSADTSPGNNPQMAEISVTLPETNQVSKRTFQYDQYNNQTDVYEYDFGSAGAGLLIRHTHTDYANSVNLINNLDYTLADGTTGIRLLSLPIKQQVFDGNGALRAQTAYEYDNYDQIGSDNFHDPLVPRSNLTGFDTAFAETYYKRGNITKVTQFLLDSQGQVIEEIKSYSQYDIAGNVIKTIDPRSTAGNIIATGFDFDDQFGSPDSEARSNTRPSELTPAGQPELSTFAFPTKVTNAVSHISYAQFNYYLGAAVNTEDQNGVVSSIEYGNGGLDLLDRTSKVVRAINTAIKNQTTFAYNDAARTITNTSDLKAYGDNLLKSETIYDGLGRTTETRQYETSTAYITSRSEFDALGRVKRTFNPYRTTTESTYGWTDITYDELSRSTKVETFDQSGASTGFVTTDYSGNRVLVKDQDNKQRLSQIDAGGRLTDVWEVTNDPTSHVEVSFGTQSLTGYLTHYDYDALDSLITVTQRKGASETAQIRSFLNDSLKRLKVAINPESGQISFNYDAVGNLTQRTDARGVLTTYGYDNLNRAISRTYSDGTPTVTYTYDAVSVPNSKGRLTSVSSSVSTFSYGEYDGLGRVISSTQTTDGQNYQVAYSYDLAGNLRTQTYPSGRVVETEFDSAGRLAGAKNFSSGLYYAGGSSVSNDPTYANRIEYTAHGALAKVRRGNGLWEHTNFNSRLQATQIGLGTQSTNSSVLQLDYSYGTTNNNGNVRSQTITVPGLALTQSYTYDDLNRLKSAAEAKQGSTCPTNSIGTTDCWKQTFSYDRYGNRRFNATQTTDPAITPQNQNSTNPETSETTNKILPAEYRYDAAGNLECDPLHPCGQASPYPAYYKYDAENRIKEANGGAANGGSTYVYDGDGRRVKKLVGQSTVVFLYSISGRLVAEYSNTVSSEGGGTNYLTADHLGTPRVITRQDQAVNIRRDYMPFGEEISASIGGRPVIPGYSIPSGTRQEFTSKERDIETGLDYFLARYYASFQGRFTSVDPITVTAYRLANPQGFNGYSYAINNPLKFTDPTGKDIRFKNKKEAEQGLAFYRNGLEKKDQSALSIKKNKDGSYSLKVDDKAGKGADKFSLLGRLYAATTAPQIAVISAVRSNDKISFSVVSVDGKRTTQRTSLGAMNVDGLTLLPAESREKAQPKSEAPKGYSTQPNVTQIYVSTNGSHTATQAVYAETLAHFGEFVRTGNPVAATHFSSTVTYIENVVVEEAGENEQANRRRRP